MFKYRHLRGKKSSLKLLRKIKEIVETFLCGFDFKTKIFIKVLRCKTNG